MTQEKDIQWINTVKGIAMVMVIFAHAQMAYGCEWGTINNFLFPWISNVFFFLSGYLIYRKQLSEPLIQENGQTYLKSGAKTMLSNIFFRLVVPALLFSLLEFFPKSILFGYGFTWNRFLFKTIGGGTYWFISALTLAELFTLLLLLTRKRNVWFYVSVSLVIAGIGLLMANLKLELFPKGYWAYKNGMIAMLFLALGALYWRYEKQIDAFLKWYVMLLMAVVVVALALSFKFVQYNTRMSIPSFVVSVFSILLVIQLCKWLPENRYLSFIGKNTLGFYLFSGSIPILLGVLAYNFLPEWHWWMILLIWIVGLVLIYLVVKLIVRWLPWLFDLRRCRSRADVSRSPQDGCSR